MGKIFYSQLINIKIPKKDGNLIDEACEKRGEDRSSFIRRAYKRELAKLGLLSKEEKEALEVKNND